MYNYYYSDFTVSAAGPANCLNMCRYCILNYYKQMLVLDLTTLHYARLYTLFYIMAR